MDSISWVVLGGITLLNIGGWVYTKTYTYGKFVGKMEGLEKKVKDLDDTINDGLVEEVNKMGKTVAKLDGTVTTFIDLAKRKK